MGPPLIFRTTDSSVIPLKRSVLWPSLQVFGSDEKVQTSQFSTDSENMWNWSTNSDVILLPRSAVGLSKDSQNSHRLVWIPVPFGHKKVFTYRDYRSLAVSRSIGTIPILRIRYLNHFFRIESQWNHLLRNATCTFWIYTTTLKWSCIWRLSI